MTDKPDLPGSLYVGLAHSGAWLNRFGQSQGARMTTESPLGTSPVEMVDQFLAGKAVSYTWRSRRR